MRHNPLTPDILSGSVKILAKIILYLIYDKIFH